MISPEQIEAIRQATDIVEVVSGYLTLRQAGRNFTALCPFHREKTPSFNVNPERQIFKCFGCQEGGDVFGFLMAIESISFPDAARILADRAGILLDETRSEVPAGPDRNRLAEAMAFAAGVYQQALHRESEGAPGRDYLQRRGIDSALARAWGIGFSPADRDYLLLRARRAGFSVDELADAGLCYRPAEGRGPADRFTRRVMFPIWSTRDQIVGFGGRAISDDQRGKYINSAEGPLFQKSRLLYGHDRVNRARRERPELRQAPVYVAEGYLDVIGLHAAGLETAVAPLGTALTSDHVRVLRPSGNAVVLVFDGDRAGQDATRRAIGELMRQDVEVRVTRPSPGGDPFSVFQEQGAEALRALVEDTVTAYAFLLESALAVHGDSVEGRAAAASDLAEVLGQTPNAVKEDGYIRQAAFDLRTDEGALRKLWRLRKAGRPIEVAGGPVAGDGPGSRLTRDSQAEHDLGVALLGDIRLVGRAVGEIPLREVEDARVREVLSILYALHEQGVEIGPTTVVSRLQAREDTETLRLVTDLITEVDRRIHLQTEGRLDRDRDPFVELYDGYLGHMDRRRAEAARSELKDRMMQALAASDAEAARDHLTAITRLDRSRRGSPLPEAEDASPGAEGTGPTGADAEGIGSAEITDGEVLERGNNPRH